MASTPLWKLRRLAPRAIRIQARRADESPAIRAYEATVRARAGEFIAAYDAARRYEPVWKKEMAEGRGAIAALVRTIRTWLPLVARDVTEVKTSGFTAAVEVADDVLGDAERLSNLVRDHLDAAGAPLPYRDQLLTALDAAEAHREWSEAEAADSSYQQMLAGVRNSAAVFDAELQAFRRTLFAVCGSSDKDYQKLRVKRAAVADIDDDPDAPPAPASVEPAPPGTTAPSED
jgi:hypothetical protein